MRPKPTYTLSLFTQSTLRHRSVRITGERQTSAIEKYTQLRMCSGSPLLAGLANSVGSSIRVRHERFHVFCRHSVCNTTEGLTIHSCRPWTQDSYALGRPARGCGRLRSSTSTRRNPKSSLSACLPMTGMRFRTVRQVTRAGDGHPYRPKSA